MICTDATTLQIFCLIINFKDKDKKTQTKKKMFVSCIHHQPMRKFNKIVGGKSWKIVYVLLGIAFVLFLLMQVIKRVQRDGMGNATAPKKNSKESVKKNEKPKKEVPKKQAPKKGKKK